MPARARGATTSPPPTPPVPRAPGVFATSGVPAARRVELWESHNAAALIGLDVRAARPLDATEVNVRLPQARVARVSGSAHAVERTAAVIDRSPADSVAVYLTLRGDARFACQDGQYRLRPGDALVWETDQPFAREFAHGLEELVVTIPRTALAARAGVTRLDAPVTVPFSAQGAEGPTGADVQGRPYARALARIAGRATRTGPPLDPDEHTVLDLVAVLAGGRDTARATAHRAAARCYIEEHLTDPNLGAEEIAAAIGLSERQLSRVFAADGTSVPRHILSRRLELAHAVLARRAPEPTAPGRAGTEETVADIAARCGFTSAAYFSHMFRTHFGFRASDLRRGFSFPPSEGVCLGPGRPELRQSRTSNGRKRPSRRVRGPMPAFDDGLAETEMPTGAAVETDVLIIGSGPAGGAAALSLASLGVPNIMITKYRWTANTPRAHITNQRAMEIFRDFGIEDQVLADATPHALVGDTVFCTSIAGEEIGRILTWGTHPAREADYQQASPCLICDIPQTYLEPILVKNATARGTQTRFSTEYLSHTQDADGVTATVRDRLTGQVYNIRAKYLIGADGGRSLVADQLGLPFEGQMDIAGSMNITFKADISRYVASRPSVLYWVIQPGSNVGGIGAGLVRMIRPWHEWLIVWGYDISQPPPDVNAERATEIVRNLVGVPDLEVEITGTSLWGNNEYFATHLQKQRVFCAGDAVHRHPPSNGLGSNTSIQDSYNLAWKLAAVIRGYAGPDLLETYSAERAPVARQIVTRANKSSREFVQFFEVLGLTDAETEEEMRQQIEERKANTPRGAAKRAALVEAMELKNYEFNAHGVELGQFYQSTAVQGDGSQRPAPQRDPELYYQASTVPGAHLPHAWVGDAINKVSTLDLAPYDTFTLITGIAGEPWAAAAAKVSDDLGVPLKTVIIGPGREITDIYYDWARLREVDEDGVLLVRPDKFIGWRAMSLPADPEQSLRDALAALLSR